jgi:hypothetical protein
MTRTVSRAELNKPTIAHTEANDVHDYAFTPGCSEPRNMSGTTAHEKLRAFWGVKAGGHGRQPKKKSTFDSVMADMKLAAERNKAKRLEARQQEAG